MTRRFARFACIDWSGAVGPFQKGIAVAVCEAGGGPPYAIAPPDRRGWSRAPVPAWLLDLARNGDDILVGIDFSPSLPFVDRGAFFPGWEQSPPTVRDLWRLVDGLGADDDHLAAGGLISHPELRQHFRHIGHRGAMFEGPLGRFRKTETRAAAARLRPASCFNLIGANQVGKSSLTGMRVLHRLGGAVPIWPFDPAPDQGPLIVEIYTTIAARAAGVGGSRSKLRDQVSLDAALDALDSPPATLDRHDDHLTDAVITAAWLRQVAHRPDLWQPDEPDWPALVATEGWTFGVI